MAIHFIQFHERLIKVVHPVLMFCHSVFSSKEMQGIFLCSEGLNMAS